MSKFANRNGQGGKRYTGEYQRNVQRGSKGCFKCGKEGHFAKECTSEVSVDKSQIASQSSNLEFPQYDGPKLHELPGEVLSDNQLKTTAEQDVGISKYLDNDPETQFGFSCILKHRYSDFNVNEIDEHGQVIRLSDLEPPNIDAKPSLAEIIKNIKYPIYEDLPENIRKWITPISWSRLLILGKLKPIFRNYPRKPWRKKVICFLEF